VVVGGVGLEKVKVAVEEKGQRLGSVQSASEHSSVCQSSQQGGCREEQHAKQGMLITAGEGSRVQGCAPPFPPLPPPPHLVGALAEGHLAGQGAVQRVWGADLAAGGGSQGAAVQGGVAALTGGVGVGVCRCVCGRGGGGGGGGEGEEEQQDNTTWSGLWA
jgi:hypothetical protein